MRWRLLKLDWAYAIGELIIVIVGVLVALAIDQWNDDRLDRAEEVSIVERLLSDVERDLVGFERGLSVVARKVDSLDRVYPVLAASDSEPDDPVRFLGDVINGANYGWNQHIARRVTFDALLGSGKFGLIRAADLRVTIAEYYALDDSVHNRIDERETRYPHVSYQLVPRVNEFELEPNLSEDELQRLVAGVLASSLRDHVIAEMNFARFTHERFIALQTACRGLIERLQTYRDSMG